jgi:hypothetical protein
MVESGIHRLEGEDRPPWVHGVDLRGAIENRIRGLELTGTSHTSSVSEVHGWDSKADNPRANLSHSREAVLGSSKDFAKQDSSLDHPKIKDRPAVSTENVIIPDDSDGNSREENTTDHAADISDPRLGDSKSETRYACVSCTEEYPQTDTIQTECGHRYCRECIQRLFATSLTNEVLFPPRCCRLLVPVSTAVEDIIGLEMTRKYKERKLEVSDSKKTYCSKPTCSRYILSQNIRRGVAVCESCMARTCVKCKNQAHRGECEIEWDVKQNSQELLELLARKKQWQRCYKCSRIIERDGGCAHIQ